MGAQKTQAPLGPLLEHPIWVGTQILSPAPIPRGSRLSPQKIVSVNFLCVSCWPLSVRACTFSPRARHQRSLPDFTARAFPHTQTHPGGSRLLLAVPRLFLGEVCRSGWIPPWCGRGDSSRRAPRPARVGGFLSVRTCLDRSLCGRLFPVLPRLLPGEVCGGRLLLMWTRADEL